MLVPDAYGKGYNATWQFKENEYSQFKNLVHFVPIWYPDGKKYAVNPRLKMEMGISQAFKTKLNKGLDVQDESENETGDKETEEYKTAYRYINQKLYEMLTNAKGYDLQEQFLKVNNFLRAFCRMTSPQSSLNNSNKRFLLLHELSKQAKKERSIEMKSSSNMWNVQL